VHHVQVLQELGLGLQPVGAAAAGMLTEQLDSVITTWSSQLRAITVLLIRFVAMVAALHSFVTASCQRLLPIEEYCLFRVQHPVQHLLESAYHQVPLHHPVRSNRDSGAA